MAPSCLPLPRTLCPSPLPLLLSLSVVVSLHAYPSFYLAPNSLLPFRQLHPSASSSSSASFRPSKRAFDRLDVSPFDFDAMTKRFDEELSALPFDGLYLSDSPLLRKRAFDRLEDSGFFGQKRKRVFDRLDTSFMLAKRRK